MYQPEQNPAEKYRLRREEFKESRQKFMSEDDLYTAADVVPFKCSNHGSQLSFTEYPVIVADVPVIIWWQSALDFDPQQGRKYDLLEKAASINRKNKVTGSIRFPKEKSMDKHGTRESKN